MKQILKNNVDTAPSSLLTHTPLYPTADQPPIGSLHHQLTCLLSGILTILGFLRVSQTELLLPFCQAAALVSQWLPDLSVFVSLFLPPPDCFPTTRAPVGECLAVFLFYPQIIFTYPSSSISVVPTPGQVLHPLPSRTTYSLPAEISSILFRCNLLFQTKAKWLF